MAATKKTLLVIGSGPGIDQAATNPFASKRYDHIVLISRRADQLKAEKSEMKKISGVKVKTSALDVTATAALNKALDAADADFGKPEFVYYNAARVMPSQLLSHDVREIEYDSKVSLEDPT